MTVNNVTKPLAPTLEQQAAQLLDVSTRALQALKESAQTHQRISHEAHLGEHYSAAVAALELQKTRDEARLVRIKAVGR